MAIAFVGESTLFSGTGDTTLTYSPAAGNTLILCIGQVGTPSRTYEISDNIDGTTGWVQAKRFVGTVAAQVIEIWYKKNIPSGITDIDINQVGTGVNYRALVAEFSGFGSTVNVDSTGELEELVASDNHTCNTIAISITTDGLCVTAGVTSGTVTSTAAGSGFTEMPSGSTDNRTLFQWRVSSASFSSDGPWSCVGTDRTGTSAMVMLGGPSATDPFFTQLDAAYI